MTDRDWEAAARRRLEHVVADTVSRMRDAVDQIDRESARNIIKAGQTERSMEFHTYQRVAAQIIHTVQTLLFNLRLDSLIDAAADAEAARTEKLTTGRTTEADKLAGAVKALTAMAGVAKGWAETSAEEERAREVLDRKPADRQEFMLSDILAMIADAGREMGVEIAEIEP